MFFEITLFLKSQKEKNILEITECILKNKEVNLGGTIDVFYNADFAEKCVKVD